MLKRLNFVETYLSAILRSPGMSLIHAAAHDSKQIQHMRTIKSAFHIGLAAMIISSLSAADDQAVKKDMAQLQGEWTMVSGSADGQPMPEQMLKQMKRICKGDETTTTMAGQT
jgi:hypothetical protein